MKNEKFTTQDLIHYLEHYGYRMTYRQGSKDAFYNYRNRKHILISTDTEILTREQVITLFKDSNATDLPPEVEFSRFHLFCHFKQTSDKNIF